MGTGTNGSPRAVTRTVVWIFDTGSLDQGSPAVLSALLIAIRLVRGAETRAERGPSLDDPDCFCCISETKMTRQRDLHNE